MICLVVSVDLFSIVVWFVVVDNEFCYELVCVVDFWVDSFLLLVFVVGSDLVVLFDVLCGVDNVFYVLFVFGEFFDIELVY